MKKYIRQIIALTLLLTVSGGAWAGDVKQGSVMNATVTFSTGGNDYASTLSSVTAGTDVYVKVVVNDGYYIEESDIVLNQTIGSGYAQAPQRRRAPSYNPNPGVAQPVTFTLSSGDASDLTSEHVYTFTMPEDNNVTVDATARTRTSLDDYTVNVTSVMYTGVPQTATTITVTKNDETLTEGTDYDVTTNDGGTDVGGYEVIVTGKNRFSGTQNGSFDITQADISSVTIAPIADVSYNTYAHTPEITVTLNGNPIGEGDKTFDIEYTNNVNVGHATVTLTPKENGNFSGTSKTTQFVIITAVLELEGTLTASGTYGMKISEITNLAGTVKIQNSDIVIPGTWSFQAQYEKIVPDVGITTDAYQANFLPNGGWGNFNTSFPAQNVTLTIAKADPIVTAPTARDGLEFTNEPQALVEGGGTTGGTLFYFTAMDDNAPDFDASGWSTDIPSVTRAGTHYVWTKVEGDGNYNGVGVSEAVEVTIGKGIPVVTPPVGVEGLLYMGYDQALVTSSATATLGATVLYSLTGGDDYIAYDPAVLVGNNAGDYTVYYKVDETENYNAVGPQSITVNIDKAINEFTIQPTIDDWTYGEPANEPNDAFASFGTPVYKYASVDDKDYNSRYTETAPATAGGWVVKAFVEGTANYGPAESEAIDFTIEKATPTITTAPTASAITYGQMLASSTLSDGVASAEGDFVWTAAETKPDAVGSADYEVMFTPTDVANYNSTTVNVTVTVNAATYTVTGTAVATATYGTAVKNISISGLTVKGVDNNDVEGTWAFDADDNTILHTGNTDEKVATFTPATPDANYATLTVEIAPYLVPKSITITWGGETAFAYDGTEKKPTATIGEGQLVGDDVCGLSISGGATDKGNHVATATATNGDYVVYNDTQDFTIGNRVIVLNETDGWATLNQHNGETVEMSFTRSFKANETSTVCLPFDYTPVAADGKCYTFTSVDVDGSGDYTVTMTETDQKIAAGTAFIFKKATEDGVVVFHNGAYDVPSGGYSNVIQTTKGAWTFSGTYTKKTWEAPQTNLYGFAASDFVPTAGGTVNAGDFVRFNSGYTNAFRAYMMYNSSGAPAMNHASSTLPDRMKVVLVDIDAMVTDISSPAKVAAVAEGWYTMDGRKLQNKPTKKGLYIYGGRTVVVK